MNDDKNKIARPPSPTKKPSWRQRINPLLSKAQPITQVIEGAARIAVHLQKPTILGVVGAAAAGSNALRDLLQNTPSSGHILEVFCSRSYLLEVFQSVGAHVRSAEPRAPNAIDITIHSHAFRLRPDGAIYSDTEFEQPWIEWLRQMLDRTLPNVLEIRPGHGQERYHSTQMSLTPLCSSQSEEIWAATRPLLVSGSRVILLTGRPGVGKTTMAQSIARLANLGRVVQISNTIIGALRADDSTGTEVIEEAINFKEGLAMLSPGVVIVDDIDKIHLRLSRIEDIRKAAKLVIFTANNGEQDEVLDNATTRPARIDEVFEVLGGAARHSPFDRLTDAEWAEAKEWPVASLNELEARILLRPNNIRFEDLRQRVHSRTRSVRGLY